MYRMCYISTARQPIDRAICEDILSASRINNQRDGLTGLLIAGRRRFLQALEGEEALVRRAFHRIKQDPRHFGCVILEQRSVSARQFPLWSMGFEQSEDGAEGVSDARLAAVLIGQIADANLRAQFEGFLTLQWKGDLAA